LCGRDGKSDWFFDEDEFAGFEGGHTQRLVELISCQDEDYVHFCIVDDF
jgi:hypothetical protein